MFEIPIFIHLWQLRHIVQYKYAIVFKIFFGTTLIQK